MRLIFLLTFSTLVACSPQKRLARLVAHHPELVSHDTILRSDTTIVEAIHSDTTFVFRNLIDTFILEKDRLKIKVVRDHDTLRITGDVRSDTIVKEIPVIVNSVNPVEPISRWNCILIYMGYAFIAALIGFGVWYLLPKRK